MIDGHHTHPSIRSSIHSSIHLVQLGGKRSLKIPSFWPTNKPSPQSLAIFACYPRRIQVEDWVSVRSSLSFAVYNDVSTVRGVFDISRLHQSIDYPLGRTRLDRACQQAL